MDHHGKADILPVASFAGLDASNVSIGHTRRAIALGKSVQWEEISVRIILPHL
jgi:hypothetical protein